MPIKVAFPLPRFGHVPTCRRGWADVVNGVTPTRLLLTARKAGSTQVIIWDDQDRSQSIDVLVQTELGGFRQQIDRMFPGNKIKIPNDLVIVFWEQEPGKGNVSKMSWDYPENHCYSVLYLPDAGSASASKAVFAEHLMCCYKPWAPPPPPHP